MTATEKPWLADLTHKLRWDYEQLLDHARERGGKRWGKVREFEERQERRWKRRQEAAARAAAPAVDPVGAETEPVVDEFDVEDFAPVPAAGRIDVDAALAHIRANVDMRDVVDSTGDGEGSDRIHCPFHGDGDPSMTLYDLDDEGNPAPHAHCYVCGRSWDPVQWLRDRRGIGFIEALRELNSGKLKVSPVSARASATSAAGEQDWTDLALAAAHALRNPTTALAEQAMLYLIDRGFDDERILRSGFGVIDETVADRLLPLNREGKPSRMWRGRITIPTIRPDATCAAIKGRTLASKPEAGSEDAKFWRKYLNTKGSSTVLYNPVALKADGDLYLVEGELDAVTLQQCGLGNVVAVPGLGNLKPAQAEQLKGRKVYVLLDPDTQINRVTFGDLSCATDAELDAEFGNASAKVKSARKLIAKLRDAGADVWLVPEIHAEHDANDLLVEYEGDSEMLRELLLAATGEARQVGGARQMIPSQPVVRERRAPVFVGRFR